MDSELGLGGLCLEDGLHEAFKVVGHFFVVQTRLLGILELLFVDVAIFVANRRWAHMVGQVVRLSKAEEVWSELSNAPLHRLLHSTVRSRSQEARIVQSRTIVEHLLQTVDLGNEVEQVSAPYVLEAGLFNLSPKDFEL